MRWRAANRRGSAAAGTSLAQIDTALSSAVDSLNTSLGYVPATTSWLLSRHTVAHLLALRGSGGAPAYPSLNTSAPTLLGLPVLTSSASATTGLLVSPGAILLGENEESRYEDEEVFQVRFERRIMAALAGEIAQHRYNPDSVEDQHAIGDRLHVHHYLDALDCPTQRIREAYWKLLRLRTEHLVDRLWPKVERIAALLLARKSITGEEASEAYTEEWARDLVTKAKA